MDVSIGAQGQKILKNRRKSKGRFWIFPESYEKAKPENEMNTVMMVEVLESSMNNPYSVSLDKPRFNYDPDNKKEFQVSLPVSHTQIKHC